MRAISAFDRPSADEFVDLALPPRERDTGRAIRPAGTQRSASATSSARPRMNTVRSAVAGVAEQEGKQIRCRPIRRHDEVDGATLVGSVDHLLNSVRQVRAVASLLHRRRRQRARAPEPRFRGSLTQRPRPSTALHRACPMEASTKRARPKHFPSHSRERAIQVWWLEGARLGRLVPPERGVPHAARVDGLFAVLVVASLATRRRQVQELERFLEPPHTGERRARHEHGRTQGDVHSELLSVVEKQRRFSRPST